MRLKTEARFGCLSPEMDWAYYSSVFVSFSRIVLSFFLCALVPNKGIHSKYSKWQSKLMHVESRQPVLVRTCSLKTNKFAGLVLFRKMVPSSPYFGTSIWRPFFFNDRMYPSSSRIRFLKNICRKNMHTLTGWMVPLYTARMGKYDNIWKIWKIFDQYGKIWHYLHIMGLIY